MNILWRDEIWARVIRDEDPRPNPGSPEYGDWERRNPWVNSMLPRHSHLRRYLLLEKIGKKRRK